MKYSEIKIGDKAEIKHKITQKDIEKFVELTGDDNKLHTDEEYSELTSLKKPVVHGMLGASFISTIIGTKLPGDGALWYSQNLEFLKSVRVGDELRITAEVVNKFDRTKTVELRTDIYNQHKQKVTAGTSKVKIVELVQIKTKEKKRSQNKTVLVIGGTGGIGSATCVQLAKDGFNIVIHYHKNKNKAIKLKGEIEKIGRKAIIVSGDITLLDDVMKMKEKSIR